MLFTSQPLTILHAAAHYTNRSASTTARTNFKNIAHANLSDIYIPDCVHCIDFHCKDHETQIEDYAVSVMESIESAARISLPTSGNMHSNNRHEVVPGWSDLVKPYAAESKFWYSVWLSSGKPIGGYIFDCMKTSKSKYKNAVRLFKKYNDKIQK